VLPALWMMTLLTAAPTPHEVTGGVAQLGYVGFYHGTGTRNALELGYRFRPARGDGLLPVAFGGGARLSTPREGEAFPAELFAQASVQGELGLWAPMVGVELGYSGLNGLDYRRRGELPPGIHAIEQARASAPFLGFNISPARFSLGRWRLSALELQLGTTLLPPGAINRSQLVFLRVGYTL
jgi:hypothetical protein